MSPPESLLQNLDYSILQQCMHCGLCLPTCPTYDATRIERHSPRGRISLMRAIAVGELEASRTFAKEMSFCLGCLACTSACPAGVDYAHLFEQARTAAELSQAVDSPGRRLLRGLTIGWLFMNPRALARFVGLLRFYQHSGVQRLLRHSKLFKLLPRRLSELEAFMPVLPKAATALPGLVPALVTRQFRVVLLRGCAQDLLLPAVNSDTAEVLARNGCEVIAPPDQPCCGSLHAHNGELALAQVQARRNLDLFPPAQFDAIISNAGGCGSHLKHYGRLLAEDPVYAERAALWDRKVKDVHEWLAETGLTPPARTKTASLTVTYHDSCHLRHGQRIIDQPRALLRKIPGLRLVELVEADWCCGSAGVYNLTQPAMADMLLQRKLDHIARTGASVVATANPGCLLQLIQGARRRGLALRVAHPVSLLAEAYRNESAVIAN